MISIRIGKYWYEKRFLKFMAQILAIIQLPVKEVIGHLSIDNYTTDYLEIYKIKKNLHIKSDSKQPRCPCKDIFLT